MAQLHAEFWGTPITLELVKASLVEQGTPSGRMDESSGSNTDEGEDDGRERRSIERRLHIILSYLS
jgi:hypothetical protein